MKKIKAAFGLFLVVCSFLLVLCSCATNNNSATEDDTTEQSNVDEIAEKSLFVGKWICLRENSCNNKEIVLTISQEKGQLNIIRDMESQSSSGSKITFSVDIPDETSFYSSNTKATYTITDGVLTESFEDGKTNYFSATGELLTNICGFPFCSNKCGDSLYCESHNTESKRYSSLSDGNKKSIGYFIKDRYDYYDSINGGYAGDKYSDRIMQEAANEYGLSVSQIEIIWMNFYSY